MKFTFGGDAETTYVQYIDLGKGDHGSTLVAEPGKTYDIAPAAGQVWHRATGEVDDDGQRVFEQFEQMPPDDRWKPARAPRASQSSDTPRENG